MAMAVHESPDMTTKLWPVRKRPRRDSSSPPTPPATATTTTSNTTAVPFRVHKKWRQHAAPANSAGPDADGVAEVAGDDDWGKVHVVFTRLKARARARRRGPRPRTTTSSTCPIQQHECPTTAAGEAQLEAEEKVVSLEPWVVAIPATGTPLWHGGQATSVDPLWIIRRLPPPIEPPASPVNAVLEAEVRILFDEVVRSGESVFRFCAGPGPGLEHVECCDILTAWVFRLLEEGSGDELWQERIERLVYKVLFEYIMKMHFGGTCGNVSRIAGSVDAGELMNCGNGSSCGDGQMPEEPLLDMLMWLKDVATDPCEPRKSGMLQEWYKWQNVNINSHIGLPTRGPNGLNLNECPIEDNIMCWREMVLCSREALFAKIKDILPTEDFPYRVNRKQSIHQHLSGTPQSAEPISPDSTGSSSVEQSESVDSLASTHRLLLQPQRRFVRSLALLKLCDSNRKRVPIGPAFQADVPEWKSPSNGRLPSDGDEYLSDSRWLGTQLWPIECNQEPSQETIGKGRDDSCVCPFPRSVGCVRYHVRVARLKLGWNFGKAFDCLGFNDMGEEVSNSWTSDEERIFGALVKLNPLSENKSFWGPALKLFGSKSRQKIVSYYFNVFVPRRMGIQTRFLGGDADSDDDEVNIDDYEDLYPGLHTNGIDHQMTA